MGGGASKEQQQSASVAPIASAKQITEHKSDSVEMMTSSPPGNIEAVVPLKEPQKPTVTNHSSPTKLNIHESAAPIDNSGPSKSVRYSAAVAPAAATDGTVPGAVHHEEESEPLPAAPKKTEPNPQTQQKEQKPIEQNTAEIPKKQPQPRDSKIDSNYTERVSVAVLQEGTHDDSAAEDERPPPRIVGAFGGDAGFEGGGGVITGVKGLLAKKKRNEVVVIKQGEKSGETGASNKGLDRLDSVSSFDEIETTIIVKNAVITAGHSVDTSKKTTTIPTQSDAAHPFGFFD
ncbi:hypothetical protein BDR26DRAFT_870065 [Obelidium mucronatum]|nr:hypothetical protein BDR26DRAFT_870065 [Obelidium mucronatum]